MAKTKSKSKKPAAKKAAVKKSSPSAMDRAALLYLVALAAFAVLIIIVALNKNMQ